MIDTGDATKDIVPEAEMAIIESADLCLHIGTECVLPAYIRQKMVNITVNSESSSLDPSAKLSIYGNVEDVVTGLMNKLKISIPKYRLRRFI